MKGPSSGPESGTLTQVTVELTAKESPKRGLMTLPVKGPLKETLTVAASPLGLAALVAPMRIALVGSRRRPRL